MFCLHMTDKGLFKGNEVIHYYRLITDVPNHFVEGMHIAI